MIIYISACNLISAVAGETTLVPFKLEDQFGKEYRDTDYRGGLFVILGSDLKGSRYLEPWAIAIRNELKKHDSFFNPEIFRIADVRGVVFFLKGIVKSKFPKNKDQWVAIDWGGNFCKQYDFKKHVCNILVFDADAALVYQTKGTDPDTEEINRIVRKIRASKLFIEDAHD